MLIQKIVHDLVNAKNQIQANQFSLHPLHLSDFPHAWQYTLKEALKQGGI